MKNYRLTITGKFIITFAFALILTLTVFTSNIISNSNDAKSNEDVSYQKVQVVDGDTLWSIAATYCDKSMDVRDAIYYLKDVNNITSSSLQAGQIIMIPSSI